MNQSQVVTSLRKELASNPAANDVFHVFALRKRARRQVTLHSLSQRMKRENFNHDRKHYARLLKLLADLGFGRLETDKRGQVKALKDIRTTLQSIGRAACGEAVDLGRFKDRNRFIPIAAPEIKVDESPKAPVRYLSVAPVSILLDINGKKVNMQLPAEFTADELANLIKTLKESK